MARACGAVPQRPAQLAEARAEYYAQLQAATGQATLDITPWLQGFIARIGAAFDAASLHMDHGVSNGRYWADLHARHPDLTASQRKALARLLQARPEGFAGGMSTEKYVHLTRVSRATAYRELTQLSERGLLVRSGQGRGTRYTLAP